MAVNFSNLKKDIHLKIQDKQTPNKALIIILLKTKDRKKKTLKQPEKMTHYFSLQISHQKSWMPKEKWKSIFKVLKEKKCQLLNLHTMKIPFRNKGKI